MYKTFSAQILLNLKKTFEIYTNVNKRQCVFRNTFYFWRALWAVLNSLLKNPFNHIFFFIYKTNRSNVYIITQRG